MEPILDVKDLRVNFATYAGVVHAVRGVSFQLYEGESLAVVGESGSGKTVTAKAVMRLLGSTSGRIQEGSKIVLNGRDVVSMNKKELSVMRGQEISMIFQDSMTSLNPTMTVGAQIVENIIVHKHVGKKEAWAQAARMLEQVEIPNPAERLKNYPHQMSGGMRQRVMIAMALSCHPKILIADEPTTALDVTIQAQLMDLLRELKEKNNMAILLVTHDLGVVADFADRIQVMYAGVIVERGRAADIFRSPKHPYTWALLSSTPSKNMSRKSELYSIQGSPPDLRMEIKGCPFAARCAYCMSVCKRAAPPEYSLSEDHRAACWLLHEMAPKVQPPVTAGGRENG